MRAVILVTVGLLALIGHLDGRAHGEKRRDRPNCLQRTVSPRLIKELLNKTQTLTNSLPTFPRKIYERLLPKICTTCAKKQLGIWEINKILDVYSNVFNQDSLEGLYPKHFEDLLARLKTDVQSCLVECPTRPTWTKTTIRKMENTFKKLDTNGIYKAIGEFKTVLLWISDMRERKETSMDKCQ
ncbi:interleukin-26 [Oncorhynchus tshawytscha]|uniref:interleukin-26 n=1 Tax=Oncorhynchus tshawytscha TaxID=74940 RepID=UPI001C3DECB9|nr:interleukin-26 [Oncorhynchus tshawytscha]